MMGSKRNGVLRGGSASLSPRIESEADARSPLLGERARDDNHPKVARMLLSVALGRMAVSTLAESGW